MKKTVATAKRLLCLVCALALCLALAACGGSANSISEQSEEITQMNNAAPGGDIAAMPDGFAAPTDANKLANAVSGSSFVGAINLASYRSTGYFFVSGDSLTLTANFALYDTNGQSAATKYTDVTVALWQKSESTATYVTTVHFVADGTNQTYTFTGLQSGGEYRFGITYSDSSAYRMSGTFSASPVTSAGAEEETPADSAA